MLPGGPTLSQGGEIEKRDIGTRLLEELGRDYFAVGKRRVRVWRAWFVVGIVLGIVIAVLLVAARTV